MRKLLILTALVLVPLAAGAQTFSASLSGDAVVPGPGADGTGFAVVTFEGSDVSYSVITSGLGTITAAHIHAGAAGQSGPPEIDLSPSFVNGTATGVVSASAGDIAAVVGNPAGYYVQVHTVDFPQGALRGQLAGSGGGEPPSAWTGYFPVAAAIAGAAGTDFKTDARFVNLSGAAADVTLEYYPEGAGGNTAPASAADLTVAAGEQLALNDFVADQLGVVDGKGGVSISSNVELDAFARIYNDQTAAGMGTFGQLVVAVTMNDASADGLVPFLSNEDPASGEGYRANIGWFNPSADTVQLSLAAWDGATGDQLGTLMVTVDGWEQLQDNVGNLWLALADYGDFFLTYTASAPLFVYGSVVDNVNGDAIYVAATER